MQIKKAQQSEQDQLADRVYAAMETGNTGQARTLLNEYREFYPEHSEALRTDVIAAYGIAL